MNLTSEVQSIINEAYEEAKKNEHELITPEHLLYVSLRFDRPRFVIRECEADPDVIRKSIEGYFDKHLTKVQNVEPVYTQGCAVYDSPCDWAFNFRREGGNNLGRPPGRNLRS